MTSFVCAPDDGISPERVAQVMGQLDHCHHAVHIINELVQTAQVCLCRVSRLCLGPEIVENIRRSASNLRH